MRRIRQVRHIIFVMFILLLLNHAYTKIVYGDEGPNLPPCTKISKENLPKSRGTQGNMIWGDGVLINWMEVTPDDGIPMEKLPGDRVVIVKKGSVELLIDGQTRILEENEVVWINDGSSFALAPAGMTAEIFEIYWPAVGLDHSHNDAPFPVGAVTYREMFDQWNMVSMMRPWERINEKKAELKKPLTPSLSHCQPVNINSLQYCRHVGSVWTRIIQGKRGQVCFHKMAPGEETPEIEVTENQFHIVLKGFVEKSLADSIQSLSENDVIFLPEGSRYVNKAGENGCEILTVHSNANPELTRSLNECSERFHSIIPQDVAPVLCYDGITQKPGLTFTEGPSWLNDKLYFTNTFLLTSRPGSKDQGGLNVLDNSGRVVALNRELYPVGTFPLPNGNIAATDFANHSLVEMACDGSLVRVITDSFEGKTLGGPNDLAVDRKGGIYFTDPWGKRLGAVPGTAVYYISPHGDMKRLTDWDEFVFPNGCILSPDGLKFYLNASPGRGGKNTPAVWVYDVNEDGTITNKGKFAEIVYGRTADGLAIDRKGNLYVATGTGGIEIFDKTGGYIGHIHFPKQAQNCVFGGDDLSTLYVTCHSHIYSIQTNMQGVQFPLR